MEEIGRRMRPKLLASGRKIKSLERDHQEASVGVSHRAAAQKLLTPALSHQRRVMLPQKRREWKIRAAEKREKKRHTHIGKRRKGWFLRTCQPRVTVARPPNVSLREKGWTCAEISWRILILETRGEAIWPRERDEWNLN